MMAVQVDKELAEQYARVKNISVEEAYKKLEENMIKETVDIDLRQQYQVLINAFRKMSPQLNGVVLRETNNTNIIAALNIRVTLLNDTIDQLQRRIDFEREVYKKSMQILNGIIEEDKKTISRIAALEEKANNKKPSIYRKIVDKIKCLLNN